jgi:EamA domain-containing membrane protein RarD
LKQNPDTGTAAVDAAATAGLCVLGWATGSPWWWALAAAWAYLTYRQFRLARKAAAYRRE